jgi:hypothetical protein
MFILKRQDVEIATIQHPKRDQQVPILYYQGQTFRLISIFKATQEEEAKAFWRELTDNRGKACILLEEPDRYSIWGKIRLEQLENETGSYNTTGILTVASLFLLQAVYMDIQDLLGSRQAISFEKEIAEIFNKYQFPQTSSPQIVKYLLTTSLLNSVNLPTWQENHLISLLQELHRLGKAYFGNTSFAKQVYSLLQDMPEDERALFIGWLKQSPLSKLWQ